MEDVSHDMYIMDTFRRFYELTEELRNCSTAREFKEKLEEINDYMASDTYIFGKDEHFISPAILENLEAVKGIEKIWKQQKSDRRTNIILFIVGMIVGLLFNILVSYFTN
jgi:hypothetical protein